MDTDGKKEWRINMAEPKVLKTMSIMDVAQGYPVSIPVFQAYGMHCLGCMAAQFENIEQGCLAHGIDADMLVRSINDAIDAVDATRE